MNYEERSKIPIEQRLNSGFLKEAQEILKSLYNSNGVSDRTNLMKLSKTNSCSYLLTELNPKYIKSIDGEVRITEFGREYIENLKPDVKVIDVDEKKEKLQIKEIKKALAAIA